ncbi:MAG: hypothetical protein KF878_17300 [Planctomycetes bacterium]|nr:hypothetical protein [Planctomycetota bacterium]
MRSALLRALPALLLTLSLTACPSDGPPPTPPGTGSGGGTPPAGQGGADPGRPDDAPAAQPGGGDAAESWQVIASPAVKEEIYPMLQAADTWPAPAGLKAVGEVPAERRPDPSKVRALKELVAFVVHPDLRPRDMDAAIGVDAQGRTFMRLGKDRTRGSASVDVRRRVDDVKFDHPVFAITIEDPSDGGQSLDRLKRRVRQVVAPELAREMEAPKHELVAHPKVNGEQGVAAMAMLDRQGFGGQFPYLYAFGSDKHLLVLLQEVPHMSLGGDDGQGPR